MSYKHLNISLIIIMILIVLYLFGLATILYLRATNPNTNYPTDNIIGAMGAALATGLAIAVVLALSFATFFAAGAACITLLILVIDTINQVKKKNATIISIIFVAFIILGVTFGISLTAHGYYPLGIPLLLYSLLLIIYLIFKFRTFNSNILKQL